MGAALSIGVGLAMKIGVEVQNIKKVSKASFPDPLELTTKFMNPDNSSQENCSLIAD
jgi:hypothetical protein